MSDVWVGRFNRWLEKLLNAKGGPVLVDLDPSLQVSVPIFDGVESRYLQGYESFAAADQQAAVAANFSAFMIRNPSGTNVIVGIEKISVVASAAGSILVLVAGSNPADLATAIATHNRADPRGRSTSTSIVSRDAPAANPTTGFLQIGFFGASTTASQELIVTPNQEIVLLPGIALRVVLSPVNLTLNCTFFFRERPLETSELT